MKTFSSEVINMFRGRHWYGPGFWKGPDWFPGAGGFRGGRRGWCPGWGPCHFWPPHPGPYYGPGFSEPEEEKAYLKEQEEVLREELNALEKRISELEESQ
ncbi:MAG: DUF5320 domain-containing protein [Bacillota bacterium]